MRHEEPAANVAPQGLEEVTMAKSAALVPPSTMPLMFKVALPVFESVAARLAEVTPWVVLGKASEEVSEATGAAAATPVPVNVVVWVGVAELSVTVMVAV